MWGIRDPKYLLKCSIQLGVSEYSSRETLRYCCFPYSQQMNTRQYLKQRHQSEYELIMTWDLQKINESLLGINIFLGIHSLFLEAIKGQFIS